MRIYWVLGSNILNIKYRYILCITVINDTHIAKFSNYKLKQL